MAKTKTGGHIDFAPHLDKPKNMPGAMPLQNTKFGKTSGGGKEAPKGKMHKEGGNFGGDQHDMHGAMGKKPKVMKGK